MKVKDEIKNHIRMYGWRNTFLMGFKKVISILLGISWNRFILFEQKISEGDNYGYDFSRYDLRIVTIKDFEKEEWRESFLNAEKRLIYQQRFLSTVDECFGLFIKGELACMGWNHYGELLVYNQFHIETENKSVYLFDDFCLPDFRGNGFHKIISAYRKHVAASKGFTHAYVAVAKNNRPPLKNQRKGGFKEIKTFAVIEYWKHAQCTLKKMK